MDRINFMKYLLTVLLVFIQVYSFANSEWIRIKTEQIKSGNSQLYEGVQIQCSQHLPLFYEQNAFNEVWDSDKLKSQFIPFLEKMNEHGLAPEDYHLNEIRSLVQQGKSKLLDEVAVANLELLLTDAFLLSCSHIWNGKVNPKTVDVNWHVTKDEGDPKIVLQHFVESGDLQATLYEVVPHYKSYARLQTALNRYLMLVKNNNQWLSISEGVTIKSGMKDERLSPIATRLQLLGDLSGKYLLDDRGYVGELEQAVRKFQKRHGLLDDGEIGNATIAALNVSPQKRAEQIKVNLERHRWLPIELGTHYVITNIADFTVQVYHENELKLDKKVVVGKPYRQTPVFSSKMSYMVFNPYWTVPPGILRNDVLPAVKKNPGYLAEKNIKLIKGDGTIVNPGGVDWSQISAKNNPYTYRQEPGEKNALGAVKFMFPNTFNVYLHDTPSKELFDKTDRAFSSGCIRVHEPLELAEYLLQSDNKKEWTMEKIKQTITKGKPETVMLSSKVDVHITYLTSWVAEDGTLHFRKDVYDRDGKVAQALDQKAPK